MEFKLEEFAGFVGRKHLLTIARSLNWNKATAPSPPLQTYAFRLKVWPGMSPEKLLVVCPFGRGRNCLDRLSSAYSPNKQVEMVVCRLPKEIFGDKRYVCFRRTNVMAYLTQFLPLNLWLWRTWFSNQQSQLAQVS